MMLWGPKGFQCGPDTAIVDMEFQEDKVDIPGTMADEMDSLRRQTEDAFHWTNKKLTTEIGMHRAAAQATLLLTHVSPDDARSENLQTKLFTLLMGELYRSHGEVLIEYHAGAFVPSARNSISSTTLEFIHAALRRAQAYFMAMPRSKPQRWFDLYRSVLDAGVQGDTTFYKRWHQCL